MAMQMIQGWPTLYCIGNKKQFTTEAQRSQSKNVLDHSILTIIPLCALCELCGKNKKVLAEGAESAELKQMNLFCFNNYSSVSSVNSVVKIKNSSRQGHGARRVKTDEARCATRPA